MIDFMPEEHFQLLNTLPPIPVGCQSFAKLNASYEAFHAIRKVELDAWLEDRAAGELGMLFLKEDETNPSIRSRKALHTIMAQAHKSYTYLRPIIEKECRGNYARKGGSSRKPNVLQKAVSECLAKFPDVTVQQLALELENQPEYDIEFDEPDSLNAYDTRNLRFTGNTGRTVSKPVGCLKDYLRRAKTSRRANK